MEPSEGTGIVSCLSLGPLKDFKQGLAWSHVFLRCRGQPQRGRGWVA